MRRTDQSWRPSRVHSSENAGLAGAPGFEPGIVGTKNRCLTTWLRPSSRNMPAARGLIGRADGKLNGENGKCRERKVRGTDPPVPADWRRVSSAVGRWHLFTPTAISLPAGSKKWNRLPPGMRRSAWGRAAGIFDGQRFKFSGQSHGAIASSCFVLLNWTSSRKSFCHRFFLIDCRSRLARRRLAFRTAASYRSCRDTAELRLRQSFQSPATGEQA